MHVNSEATSRYHHLLQSSPSAIALSFSQRSYSVMEQNGTLSDLIFVTKNNATSEQNLTILVQGFDIEATCECRMHEKLCSS